ncbi:hypothetical protein SLS62_002601 [Diatrype stigma]|uniref:Major facilitator superfamily (MFS) profile domain-containing protein n=1 Tax=Diatrype stigma TaxID=117547 RepID=A0AAN9YV09_9PEZI
MSSVRKMDIEKKADLGVPAGKVDIETVCDLDDAEIFLQENNFSHRQVAELLADEALNKRLMRKVDWTILPPLAITYMLQYIDKQALSYAAVFDLFTDTGINQDQYAFLPSLFYIAYLVAEYPWTFLAQRTRMAKVLGSVIVAWGVVLMCTAAGSNFGSLAACRFLLGAFEAPITPCFMMIIAMCREQQPFRAGVFYSCNGLGSMIGGILFYAVGQIKTIPVWKAIFLLCGGVTILWGVVVLVLLPDDILSAKRFSLREKATLVGRGKLGRTGILSHNVKFGQIKEALLDPQVWLLTLFTLLNEVINGGIANFGKLIVKGVVKDPLLTTALGIPQGAFQVIFILSGTYLPTRFRHARTVVMALYLAPTIIGTSLMWQLDRTTDQGRIGVLFAYYIVGSFVASLVIAMQMPSANLGGYTKRMTGTAVVFLAYCVGNIAGPHAFLEAEAPIYPTGCRVILACAVAQIAIAGALRWLLKRRNGKRDAAAGAAGVGGAGAVGSVDTAAVEEVTADLTDFEVRKEKRFDTSVTADTLLTGGSLFSRIRSSATSIRPGVLHGGITES